jgi:hypothetical protein
MGVCVLVPDFVVLVRVVDVIFVIRAGASQTTSAIDASHPEELIIAEPPALLLVVLQTIVTVIEKMSGTVRPSFPVRIVLGRRDGSRHVVTQRQFLLTVHQYRARIKLLPDIVVRQTPAGRHQHLAAHFDVLVLMLMLLMTVVLLMIVLLVIVETCRENHVVI